MHINDIRNQCTPKIVNIGRQTVCAHMRNGSRVRVIWIGRRHIYSRGTPWHWKRRIPGKKINLSHVVSIDTEAVLLSRFDNH